MVSYVVMEIYILNEHQGARPNEIFRVFFFRFLYENREKARMSELEKERKGERDGGSKCGCGKMKVF